jgi:cell division cycle 20-like protein 1, cofactor of APC complex
VQLWDVETQQCVRTYTSHRLRCGVLSWNGPVLSTGSRDRSIVHRDTRTSAEFTTKLTSHRQEVCGLRWSPDRRLLASGGNDNVLFVWDQRKSQPLCKFTGHSAAIKALAWSPHQRGLLASGGGTADRHIRFWNVQTGVALDAVDTGSQVCNLVWSENVNEILSTHGYSQNQIAIWNYTTGMSPVATLTGHSTRVLYLAVSPDGESVVTGAGDETLRFWHVFPSHGSAAHSRRRTNLTSIHSNRTNIR